jgi:hypothetical protein
MTLTLRRLFAVGKLVPVMWLTVLVDTITPALSLYTAACCEETLTMYMLFASTALTTIFNVSSLPGSVLTSTTIS